MGDEYGGMEYLGGINSPDVIRNAQSADPEAEHHWYNTNFLSLEPLKLMGATTIGFMIVFAILAIFFYILGMIVGSDEKKEGAEDGTEEKSSVGLNLSLGSIAGGVGGGVAFVAISVIALIMAVWAGYGLSASLFYSWTNLDKKKVTWT